MTALQFARAECSNLKSELCLGMNINDDLTVERMAKAGKTCLLARGERCNFFEECVVPMVSMVSDERKAKLYEDAVMGYQRMHPEMGLTKNRRCPDCKTATIGGGDRYCPACAAKRRKATYRESKKRVRVQNVGVMSTVSAISDVD